MTCSLRFAIERAYRRAVRKLREGESMALPVPSSIDVARELREWLPGVRPSDVRDLIAPFHLTLADSDPPRAQRRSSMPPALAVAEWAAS